MRWYYRSFLFQKTVRPAPIIVLPVFSQSAHNVSSHHRGLMHTSGRTLNQEVVVFCGEYFLKNVRPQVEISVIY